MGLFKKRIFSREPTNPFESSLKSDIEGKMPIKIIGVRVTSCLVKDEIDYVILYVSYLIGVKGITGGFFRINQEGHDLKVTIKARNEYFKKTYLIIIFILLLIFIVPGLIFLAKYILENRRDYKGIKQYIIPALKRTFES